MHKNTKVLKNEYQRRLYNYILFKISYTNFDNIIQICQIWNYCSTMNYKNN